MTRAVLGIVSFNACTANRHSCCGTHELIERPRLERRLAAYEEGESENTKRSQTASERQEPSCETDWARQVTTAINSKELIQCHHMRLDRGIDGSPTLLRQPLLVNHPVLFGRAVRWLRRGRRRIHLESAPLSLSEPESLAT